MKNWICISAIFLLNASTDAFAPHPLTFANTVRRRAAHTAHAPHQNSYLEQLAATPMKEQETQKPSTPEPEPNNSMEAAATAAPPTTQQEEEEEEEEEDSTKSLLQKVKEAGVAGAISYALWELGFWGISIPVCVVGFQKLTGHWPDLTNQEDLSKVGGEAFAFVNFARLAVPLRIGLALSTTPWIDENIVQTFMKKDDAEDKQETDQ